MWINKIVALSIEGCQIYSEEITNSVNIQYMCSLFIKKIVQNSSG